MKEEIKKLHELAVRYRDFGVESSFGQNWNYIRGGLGPLLKIGGDEVKVYFADDYKTCAVDLSGVEFTFWMNTVTIPIGSTKESLKLIHDDCLSLLNNEMTEHLESIKESLKSERQKEIKVMEEKLIKMKQIVD